MESRIRERYNDTILAAAQTRYGIDPAHCKLLDGFESFIYEFARKDGDFILRIGHSLRRDANLVAGEADWINHLAAGGVGVARAVESIRGSLVELIDDASGGAFICTAFVKALGRAPRAAGWSPELYERYGKLLGRMHALAVDYQPRRPEWLRPQWDDPILLDTWKWLPADDDAVRGEFKALHDRLKELPRNRHSYGLIHQDAHGGNMFVDDSGNITLFDFDDCVYSWYANDIAIVLFYMITNHDDPAGYAEEFMRPFLTGYRTEFTFDPEWLSAFPDFLKLREIDLYGVIHRSFDVANINHPWCARFMTGRRERIACGTPYVNFDFSSLKRWL